MNLRAVAFSVTLLLLVVASFGCKSPEARKRDREKSIVRLHLESAPAGSPHTRIAPVYRADPIQLVVERSPFLDERNLQSAAVVPTLGGFGMQLRFDRHGALVLESISTAHKGRRIAVFSQLEQDRWLGAPVISGRLTDGVLFFTPDATREEAERIVRGLNNVAGKRQKRSILN